MQNENPNPNPAPKIASLWTLMIVGGCLFPIIVICVGTLLTQ